MTTPIVAYCKGTDAIVYRIPGKTYGDGQTDSDDAPVWLLSDDDVDAWNIDELPQVNTL